LKQAAEKIRQLRSRLIEILNVPAMVRLRFRFACGLANGLFEQPAGAIFLRGMNIGGGSK
jgi:hypothetical protein